MRSCLAVLLLPIAWCLLPHPDKSKFDADRLPKGMCLPKPKQQQAPPPGGACCCFGNGCPRYLIRSRIQ